MFDVIPHRPLTDPGKSLNINTWTGEVFLTIQTRLTETKQRV